MSDESTRRDAVGHHSNAGRGQVLAEGAWEKKRREKKEQYLKVLVPLAERMHQRGRRVSFHKLSKDGCGLLGVLEKTLYDFLLNHMRDMAALRALKIVDEEDKPLTAEKKTKFVDDEAADTEGSEEESDPLLGAKIDAKYEAALESLAPAMRTRRHLAAALGTRQLVVNSYLFQRPEFAARLLDGDSVRPVVISKK